MALSIRVLGKLLKELKHCSEWLFPGLCKDHPTMAKATVLAEELTAETVKTIIALVGKIMLPPGLYPSIGLNDRRCVIEPIGTNKIESPKQRIAIDTADCAVFRVHHVDDKHEEPPTQEWLDHLLEQSLVAICEVVVWSKVSEVIHVESPFERQVGRTDVKFFALEGKEICRGTGLTLDLDSCRRFT